MAINKTILPIALALLTVIALAATVAFFRETKSEHRRRDSQAAGQTSERLNPSGPTAEAPAADAAKSQGSTGDLRAGDLPEGRLIAEFQACLQDVSEDGRRRRFLDLLQQMRPEDALGVRNLLYKHWKLGVPKELEADAFYRRWGEIDSAGALALLKTHEDRSGTRTKYEHTFHGWATKDPNAAQQWLAANSQHPQFPSAFIGFLDGYARVDSQAATRVALASLAPDDPLLPRALDRLSEQIFQQSFAAGLKNWFELLPEQGANGGARKAAADAVYKRLARQDVAVAAEWVQQQAAKPWRSNEAIRNLASRYAEADPAAAMSWVQTLPSNPTSKIGTLIGVSDIVNQWSRKDPAGLENWLNGNRGTQAFEQAAHDYALLLARSDKQKALYWANQVSIEQLRMAALQAAQK
ncbi:MAG: hypothetical protein M3463_09785 [Verrucomicrobiota bacterium]|nr:hypothetical protein [Verrucomicrobiota bacterium]